MRFPLFAAFLVMIASAQAQPSATHPFTADDWAAIHTARAAAISPDGNSILYEVDFGAAKGRTNHEWHLIRPDGSEHRKLELPADFQPFGFTRDGAALYGSYKLNNLTQLALFPLKSLNAKATPSSVIMLPAGIRSAIASPDGTRFAILADPRLPDPLAGTRIIIEPDQTSLYVVKTDGAAGQWWCAGLKNIAGIGDIAWAPGGASLAVLSSTPKIGFHYVRSFIDVCSASGARRVAEIPNAANGIGWAKDGNEIAFLSTTSPVLTPDHVWTVPASGGQPVDRTPDLDASAVRLAPDPRGHLWVLVNRGVHTEAAQFHDEALTTAYRWPDGYIATTPVSSEYAAAADQIAFTVGDPQHAGNVAVPQQNGLRKITSEGDDQLAKTALGPVRAVHWTSKEGTPLEGIATFPAGYAPGQKYPFLVLPHGGPEASDLLALDPFSRIVAGLGYVVLQPQYRGSTGYGTQFLDDIYQHFGDRAFRDVDSATDYAVAQGWADPRRLAIFGWSAGGFMTAWTVTQTSRYRAAIEGAGITDWASFMWTSDVQQIDYDARWPGEDPEAFRKFSAVDYAAKVTTPLLILHGGSDHRVPTYQGRELFEALAARGKTTRMIEYPGSPHFPVLWEQRRDVFREIVDWLRRYNP